eukprot:5654790-Prymnesium_polylepis.1
MLGSSSGTSTVCSTTGAGGAGCCGSTTEMSFARATADSLGCSAMLRHAASPSSHHAGGGALGAAAISFFPSM